MVELQLIQELGKAEAENRELRAQNEWVSVEDRLPEEHQSVNVCYDGRVAHGYWYQTVKKGLRKWRIGFYTGANVTHWMPLPKPPSL